MNTYEPKNMRDRQAGKNFLIMILFMVFAVSSAKALHDVNVSDSNQNTTELTAKEEVAFKK